jgi:sulfate transport system substrate-binding protein
MKLTNTFRYLFFFFLSLSNLNAKEIKLLNVSYDPTRELYKEFNDSFAKFWKAKTGDDVKINQSHGGSGKQARAVIDGLEADVVTLALAYDIDEIANKSKTVSSDWSKKLKYNSSPYYSIIVFLVRKGNPKQIKDWNDLTKQGVNIITPNPKTSGGARWNYLAALGYALKKFNGNEVLAQDFVKSIYKNVSVLDSGARGSVTTFVQKEMGDVLITWENEAFLATRELAQGQYEIVYPSISILAEPPVAVIDKFADKHGNTKVATAYLEYLYTPEGQEIVSKHYFRARDAKVMKKHVSTFKNIKTITVDSLGGWSKLQKKHFNDAGVFDQIYSGSSK